MDPRNSAAEEGLNAKIIIEILGTFSELPEVADEVRDLLDFLYNLQHRYAGVQATFEVDVRRRIEVFDKLIDRVADSA